MKIKFSSDSTLPLNKILKLQNLTIVVRCTFQEGKKYYLQDLVDKYLYKI